MPVRWEMAIFVVPAVIVTTVIIGIFTLMTVGSGQAAQPRAGLTAEAVLESPSGDSIGTVTFRQASSGLLIMAEVKGLAPGGHAFIVHEVGTCSPDFGAAGGHFNPTDAEHGLVHPAWKGESGGGHGGDLPNIYAASDGSARADFFTVGITLDTDLRHSVFDDDGSAIIVHENPDAYGEEESDTGQRVACGVIELQ